MSNAKVFVTQADRRLNYAEAESYGPVVFLTDKEYPCEPTVAKFRDEVVEDMKSGLSEYIPGIDYLVTTGSSIPNVIVGILLARMPGEHKILKWDNRSRRYGSFVVKT